MMLEKFKISVVIPSYNRERTIKRCIDSVRNQTIQPYEIIVVDDGSTDRTIEILENSDCVNLRILKQKHKGAQAARNMGIQAAVGEYIAFLDSDDEWLPDKLAVQVDALRKNKNAVICGNGFKQIDWINKIPKVYKTAYANKKIKTGEKKLFRMNGKSGYVYKELLMDSFCLFQALMTSKDNLIKIGLLDEKVPAFQEWDTSIRLAKECEFIYINKPLFIYHLHDGETISKDGRKLIDGNTYMCEKYKIEILSQLGSTALTQRYKELMRQCAIYKDKRMFQYFFKYVMGKINLFHI